MDYREMCRKLEPVYGQREARAIGRLVMEEAFDMTWSDVVAGERLAAGDELRLAAIVERLERQEPVQYVLGEADFCGMRLRVTPDVLIPRPETAELCRLIADERGADARSRQPGGYRVLDIGTGSGCIAVTLARELAGSRVTAWDISEGALAVARQNAERTGVNVSFERVDILGSWALLADRLAKDGAWQPFDLIVSNPPYICQSEAADMEAHVLEHEPHSALFVPDDDPLRFYRAIGNFAQSALPDGGWLYLEVNPRFSDLICEELAGLGFDADELYDDFGKTRFVKARR